MQNEPNSESESCKTNPICPAGPGGPPPPLDPPASPCRERLCKTKPNLGNLGHLGDDERASLSCETKPIRGDAARGGAPGTWDEGQMRKTNPICPRRTGRRGRGWSQSCETNPIRGSRGPIVQNEPNFGPAGGCNTPPFQYSIIPAFQLDAYRAKRTQFAARRGAGRTDRAKQSQFRRARRQGPADCAKRTQFAGACRVKQSQFSSSARGMLKGTSRITPHGVTTNAGPSVRNEPNLEGGLCKTNPIFGGHDAPPFEYSIIPGFQGGSGCAGWARCSWR